MKEKTTEQKILLSAEEEFMAKGFAGARTVEIAQKAGVTHAMLHYYFRSKEMLFDRIITDKFNQIIDSVVSNFSDYSLPVEERLAKGICAHFDFLVANPGLPRFLLSEIDRLDSVLVRNILPRLQPVIADIQKEIKMDARQLFMDIISQNIFPFLFLPLSQKAGFAQDGIDEYLERCKQENITMILKRLGL